MAVTLILASKSPARRAVLAAAGVIPVIHESEVDEPAALRDAASERGTNVEELSAEQRVSILACAKAKACLLYTSPSPRDRQKARMPSSA